MLGLRVGVKLLIAVAGLPLTYGSRVFETNVAAEDAPSIEAFETRAR